MNPNYVIAIEQDIDKLLVTVFIQLHVEETTYISSIIMLLKKNEKLKIFVDFKKLNATTKKLIPFTLYWWCIEYNWRPWCLLTFRWIFWVSRNNYNTKGQIQNNLCDRLGSIHIGSYAFWNKKWTTNLPTSLLNGLQIGGKMFFVSPTNWQGQEIFVSSVEALWGPLWKEKNDKFEEFLQGSMDLRPSLEKCSKYGIGTTDYKCGSHI